MRKVWRATSPVAVVVVAAMLAGCVPQPQHPTPSAKPSVAPVFASDTAALAAAKKAYEGYLAASDAIGNDGGKDANRIAKWVTPKWLPKELNAYASLLNTEKRLTGTTTYSNFALQQLNQSARGKVELAVYVCDDISQSRVVDASGMDVTPTTRQNILPIQIDFVNKVAKSPTLLIDGSVPWSGTNFCLPQG
jgi:hypothetical protein